MRQSVMILFILILGLFCLPKNFAFAQKEADDSVGDQYSARPSSIYPEPPVDFNAPSGSAQVPLTPVILEEKWNDILGNDKNKIFKAINFLDVHVRDGMAEQEVLALFPKGFLMRNYGNAGMDYKFLLTLEKSQFNRFQDILQGSGQSYLLYFCFDQNEKFFLCDPFTISGGRRPGCGTSMIQNNNVDEAFSIAQHKAMADIVNEAITALLEKDYNSLYADYLKRHNEILSRPFPFLKGVDTFMKKNWGPGVEVRVEASWDSPDLVNFLKKNGIDIKTTTVKDAGPNPVQRPSPFTPKDPNDILFGTGDGCGNQFLMLDRTPTNK